MRHVGVVQWLLLSLDSGLNHNGPAPFRPAPPAVPPAAPPVTNANAAANGAAQAAAGGPPQFGVQPDPEASLVPLVVTLLSLTPAAVARDVVWLDQLCSLLYGEAIGCCLMAVNSKAKGVEKFRKLPHYLPMDGGYLSQNATVPDSRDCRLGAEIPALVHPVVS
jgi:hypothetical protein